jgi:hypothetical protein
MTELDGSPDVQGVERIYLTSGFMSSLGGGSVLLSMSGSGGVGSSVTIRDIDGTPTVTPLNTLYVTNGFLSDLGSGNALLSMSGSAGGGAPTDATYWVEDANGSLSAEVVVGTTGITTAAYGSRQAAAKSGRLFLPSNGFVIERDTGAAWTPWGPLFPFTVPVDGDFSWINQGSATVSTTNGGIHISAPSNGSAQALRLRVKTLPAAPYTLTVAFLPLLHYNQFSQVAFGLRDSVSEDTAMFVIKNDGPSLVFAYEKWDSNTSGAVSSYIANTTAAMAPYPLMWIRFQDDNVNRLLSWSTDGQNFVQLHSVGRTDFITPNQALIGMNPFSQATAVTLLSWKETA